jgi:hypothetical protein
MLWALLCAAGAVQAQGEAPTPEYRVKAAFLFKFGGYIEWPEQTFPRPDVPLVIGVIGADSLADELAQIASGHSVNGRPVTVKKLKHQDALAGVQMLFVGRSESGRLGDILAGVKGPVVVVTESDDARVRGSTINFVVVDDKVRFDVDLESAEQNGIKISSRLLTVARRVTSKSS